jgi:phage terminase large subunit
MGSTKPIRINQGGTSSGKTYAILQCLVMYACTNKDYRITVAGRELTKLKEGAIPELLHIISTSEFAQQNLKGGNLTAAYNKSTQTFTFRTGSTIRFASYPDYESAKMAGKRHILFVNEATGFSYQTFSALAMRTVLSPRIIFLDYNPTSRFWVHSELLDTASKDIRENADLFISTMYNNPALSDEARQAILRQNQDEQSYRVYVQGLTGQIRELVYKHSTFIDFPHLERAAFGLDFGYTDPTALVFGGLHEGKAYVQELLYKVNMRPQDIIESLNDIIVKDMGIKRQTAMIFADNARPEIINEIKTHRFGFPYIQAAPKPKLESALMFMQSFTPLHIHAASSNLLHEASTYKYARDRANNITGRPEKNQQDHALDALRYLALGAWRQVHKPRPKPNVTRHRGAGRFDNGSRWVDPFHR